MQISAPVWSWLITCPQDWPSKVLVILAGTHSDPLHSISLMRSPSGGGSGGSSSHSFMLAAGESLASIWLPQVLVLVLGGSMVVAQWL